MRTFKGWITTTCLVAIVMVSTLSAKAGVIIAQVEAPAPTQCTEKTIKEKLDYGVIIAGVTGVIIAGLVGVIIAGANPEPADDCAVIIAG